jgi:hypothetical protein
MFVRYIFLNGSLKIIDCGVSNFGTLDSTLNIGDTISTRVTFNKTFDKMPAVVVTMREYFGGSYFSYLGIDGRSVNGNGFEAVATIKSADARKYIWYFTWIAIST